MENETTNGLEMEARTPTSIEEKPLPAPPKEVTWSAAALPAPVQDFGPTSTPSPAPGPPRLKKKVPWKGKNIMVLLPWDDERGQKGKAPTPMVDKDIESMLRDWEQLGYDTSGFNLGQTEQDDAEGSQGQSRSPWPHIQDMIMERKSRSYKVSIPDKRDWDAYVNELAEAKLRALGVSFGDDEPVASPALSNMSRQTSTQYPALPFSPPLPTASGASSHLSHIANPFSPTLITGAGLSTNQSSHPGSIASPASMHAHLQGKYNPRASVSFSPGDHPFGSPFQYPQQSSPGVWSPQQMLYQQGVPRGGSPSIHNLAAIASPSSPYAQDGYFQSGDVLAQMQQRQHLLQNQLQHQQQLQLQASARASPRVQELRESPDGEARTKSPSKTPDANQIRFNPSASLQQEIDDAEYHLEEQFQRQLEHDDYSPHSEKEEEQVSAPSQKSSAPQKLSGLASSIYADEPEEGPVLHHPQPHSRGHSLSQRPFHDSEESAAESKLGPLEIQNGKLDASDIDTNPSNLGTPVNNLKAGSSHSRALSVVSNPWQESELSQGENATAPKRPGHGAKPSVSTLNVAAKEFKFDPKSAFRSNQFAFGASNFQPTPISAYSSFAPPQSATSSHFSNNSIGGGKGKINVAAPAFTPGNSEFNFSASGPSFRPDAPVFTPLKDTFSSSVGSVGSGGEELRSSIFGNIDLATLGISKPSKKSQAVPIIRPDSSLSRNLDDGTMIGTDGRITQGEGRIKRARGTKDDGDSVPLFAEPSMPLSETSREQSPPKEHQPAINTQADKENTAPLISDGEVAVGNAVKPDEISEVSPESANKDFEPWEFQQQKQAEDFNAARPFASRRYVSGLPAYGQYEVSDEEIDSEPSEEPIKPEPKKSHTKNSLSATAKPFEFRPGAYNFTFGEPSEPKAIPVSAPPIRTVGLAASRFARSPTPEQTQESPDVELHPDEIQQFQAALPQPQSPPTYATENSTAAFDPETLALEEIDAIMHQLNQVDQQAASTRQLFSNPRSLQPSPTRQIDAPALDISSPIRLQPKNHLRSDAPSPSPRRFHSLPSESREQEVFTRGHDDDSYDGESQQPPLAYGSPVHVHRLNNGSSLPASDWDDVLSEAEESKFQHRAQFFDSHVNDLVGGLLEDRLNPLEKALETIQFSLEMMAARTPSSRRERRSISGALSDADDEDDDNDLPRRSLSPRRDKKLEKIKSIVTDALSAHQFSRPATATSSSANEQKNVLQVLEEMKEQFGQNMRLDFRAEDLRNIVEEAVEKRIPASPKVIVDDVAVARDADQKARIEELELRLARAESSTEEETKNRRAAEDRLAEVQRLLRISSEEEDRLRESMEQREVKIREIVDTRDQKVRSVEEQRSKTSMRMAVLEAAQENAIKTSNEVQNRLTHTEQELRETKQKAHHWQMEAERALEAARRHSEDAEQANETNKELRRKVDSLRTQMEESTRVREAMRGKLIGLQEDMASAAREISKDNAQRFKREQELVARQEVLDARLQAEARTRERLEQEIERLEGGERDGMRAVSECKRLEALISDLKNEAHLAEKDAMRYQREFEEARESGLSEVQRTRHYLQAEVEAANNQVNVVREDLENQIAALRNQLDQVKLDADSAQERHEMLLEEAQTSRTAFIDDLKRKHADEIEDEQAKNERQLGITIEDAQRSEQHLLERLSLSSAKTEHLQDRVAHLEEKLEIANQAASAAAQAAKTARSSSIASSPPVSQANRRLSRALDLPEKISPQALRESIMVLQEQLQDREQTIESLEAQVTELDPDSATKISKRDDEISWLRELLAVRKSDLTDIVLALDGDQWDGDRVKDAAIRLRANLQMEEQERERAMNGGSALNLPNIAASIRGAASPRVAQAVGPLAAAWGNWRKGRENSNISEVLDGRSHSSTPSKSNNFNSTSNSPGGQSFLSGLLTPPASSARTPGGSVIPGSRRESNGNGGQPSAFGSTGQRFTKEQLANRPNSRNVTPRQHGKQPVRGAVPSTPPMLRKGSYDADAHAGDFSDAGFYDDDESTVEDYQGNLTR